MRERNALVTTNRDLARFMAPRQLAVKLRILGAVKADLASACAAA